MNDEVKEILGRLDEAVKALENVEKDTSNDVFEDMYMYNREENAAQRGIPESRKYLNYGNGYLPELCPLIKPEFTLNGEEQMKQMNNYNNNFGEINPNEIIEAMQNENRQGHCHEQDAQTTSQNRRQRGADLPALLEAGLVGPRGQASRS